MKTTARTCRALVAACAFGLALECLARLDDLISDGARFWGNYSEDNLFQNDELGRHGKPFARYRKWRLNEFGYRGLSVARDRVHLVTFGASETFGLYESEDSEYPRQLERDLNERAGGVLYQVVNVAVPGQELPSATKRVPEVVARLRPQVALIYATPDFYADPPPNQSAPQVTVAVHPRFEFRLAERIRIVLKSVIPVSVQSVVREWQIRRIAKSTAALDRMPEASISRYRADLQAMLDSLRARGVQPVLLTHATFFGPTPADPDWATLLQWRKFHPTLSGMGLLDLENRINQATRDVAAQEDIPLIDIAREIPPGHANFADFEHFTTAGAALMARRLAEGLEPLLEQRVESLHVSFRRSDIHR